MKPNFFIIGAPKCATTSWAAYLARHPEIAFCEIKEPLYFCSDLRSKYHPNIRDIPDYEALFVERDGVRAAGEATPIYLYSEVAPARIRHYAPEAKIIILLRRQPGFIWSLHQQFLYRRIETIVDPAQAWAASGNRNPVDFDEPDPHSKLLNYQAVADFETQVNRVLDLFPAEQVFVSWMEDWQRDPAWLWAAICRFLNVEEVEPPEFTRENAAKFHRSALLSRLTNRPPAFLLSAARLVRQLVGAERLGAAQILREVNRRDGYRFPLTKEFETKIMEASAKGNARMNERLRSLGCLYAPPKIIPGVASEH